MLLNYLKPILYFIPLITIQMVVVPLISVQHVAPNLILILLIFYTLRHGQIYGTILGFVLGFLFDLISGGFIGAYMFSFTITGFLAGYFYDVNKLEFYTETFFFVFIIFPCAAISSFLYTAVANNNPDVRIINMIIEDGILPGLYTGVISAPMIIFYPKKGIE